MCPVHGDPVVTGMPQTPVGATERRPASHSAWAGSTRPFCIRTCRVCQGEKGARALHKHYPSLAYQTCWSNVLRQVSRDRQERLLF